MENPKTRPKMFLATPTILHNGQHVPHSIHAPITLRLLQSNSGYSIYKFKMPWFV